MLDNPRSRLKKLKASSKIGFFSLEKWKMKQLDQRVWELLLTCLEIEHNRHIHICPYRVLVYMGFTGEG